MNTKKMITTVVLAAVAIILVGSFLMPIITDYDDDVKIVKNNTTTRLASAIDGEHTMTYDATTKAVVLDGETVTPSFNRGLLFTDLFNLLYQIGSPTVVQLYSSTNLSTTFITIEDNLTVTINGHNINVAYGTESLDFECEWGYILDADGEFAMFQLWNNKQTIYVNSVDQICGANILVTTHDWFSYTGADVSLLSGTDLTADVTTGTVAGTDDIVSIEIGANGTGYMFDVDNNGTPYTVHPWIAIVPLEVTGYSDTNKSILPIMYSIPAMVILGILVSAAAIFLRSRE